MYKGEKIVTHSLLPILLLEGIYSSMKNILAVMSRHKMTESYITSFS